MSRTVMIIVAAIALLVGILAVFWGSPPPDPDRDSRNADTSTALSSKMVGRSALSHGGPAPIKNRTAKPAGTPSGPAGDRMENSPPADAVPSESGR